MTIEQALKLRVGMYVTTRFEDTPQHSGETKHKPRRVTSLWTSEDGAFVRIRINSLYGDQWLSAEAWDLAASPWKPR